MEEGEELEDEELEEIKPIPGSICLGGTKCNRSFAMKEVSLEQLQKEMEHSIYFWKCSKEMSVKEKLQLGFFPP